MKHLLEQWAAIEPQLCRKYDDNNFFLVEGDFDHHVTEKSLAWIQGAVQQAIISKGWHFCLMSYTSQSGFFARVHNLPGIDRDNPTEALLSAYLKALQDSL